jgi:hypothetical protein
VNPLLACLLALWLPAFGADFAILHLKAIEGEGMTYAPGSRATRGLTVEVTDETGRPVPGVSVSFQLPNDGPSGEFMSGSRTEIATTQADGRAAAWGMHWNKLPGAVPLRITAVKDGIRAGIVATLYLDASAPAAAAQNGKIGHGGHAKLIYISLAVAGAAGAGLAMGLHGNKSTQSNPTQTLTIGAPTAIIGAP